MKQHVVYSFIFLSLSFLAHAQITNKKRLPQIINIPVYSHIFPSVSGDGNQMIYLTNYANSEGFEIRYTFKSGADNWSEPVAIPSVNKPSLDHNGSFCLSQDGNTIVFSSRRSPGIGNYDIWFSEKKGKIWSAPINPGKPLNTTGHEGNPSLSADGKTLYFMRCETMDITKKSNCRIYVSQRQSTNRWSEAVALPESINMGHTVTPRILADNKTLLFASGRSGGKGMLDLYSTTLKDGQWSVPKPFIFLNTPQNDEYVSVPARGDIIFYNELYKENQNIFITGIPLEFRPAKILMLEGKVTYDDGKKPSEDLLVQAFELSKSESYASSRLRPWDDGFTFFLTEGSVYDISVFPQTGGHTYYSRIHDLRTMPGSKREEITIALNSIKPGTMIPLSIIQFQPNSLTLTNESSMEVKRISGFLKKNPGIRIEIAAYIDQVKRDSLPSAELTEMIVDSVKVLDEFSEDIMDSDSTGTELLVEVSDSVYMPKITYHNDRTQKMANAVVAALKAGGVPENLVIGKGYSDQWKVNSAGDGRNYWVELKILSD